MESETNGVEGTELSVSRRLHPTSLGFRFFGYLKPFAIPLILALSFAGGDKTEAWLAISIGPLMLFELLRFFTFRYRLTREGLVVREGLIFRNERLVPYARIQNIDTRQGIIHRIFGVLDVRVETATGSEPEAHLKVISRARLGELERHLAKVNSAETESLDPEQTTPPRRAVYELPTSDAILLGLSPWRGIAIVGVVFGLFAQYPSFGNYDLGLLERDWSEFLEQNSIFVSLALVLLLGLLLVGLSVFVTLMRLHGFRVERGRENLHISCGLFTRHNTKLDLARIQTLSIRRPWLLRRLGRTSLRITTAAAVQESGDESTTRQWLAPVLRDEHLPAFLGEIDPRFLDSEPHWQPLAPSAGRRMSIAAGLRILLLAIPLGSRSSSTQCQSSRSCSYSRFCMRVARQSAPRSPCRRIWLSIARACSPIARPTRS